MKKTVSLFLLAIGVLILFDTWGGSVSSTSSMIIVTEKGHTDNYREYWIKAYDPNNQLKEEAFEIVVDEEMVWHLIEENKEYFATYAQERDEGWVLEQIEHPAVPGNGEWISHIGGTHKYANK